MYISYLTPIFKVNNSIYSQNRNFYDYNTSNWQDALVKTESNSKRFSMPACDKEMIMKLKKIRDTNKTKQGPERAYKAVISHIITLSSNAASVITAAIFQSMQHSRHSGGWTDVNTTLRSKFCSSEPLPSANNFNLRLKEPIDVADKIKTLSFNRAINKD